MADGSTSPFSATRVVPPLKWAGGKRWLVERLIDKIDVDFGRLIEPFAGSAAMFFRSEPSAALLSDVNGELINVYRCMRDQPNRLYEILADHAQKHSKDYYYLVREAEPLSRLDRAARTIYLNRTCWNALYRVNKQGKFNVPKGTKENVLLATDDFIACSNRLRLAEIRCWDFARTLSGTGCGDLIFADPPYFSQSISGTFVKYTNPTFTWNDQKRLARSLIRAHARGANFVLTNVDAPDLEDLYSSTGFINRISRQTVISGKAVGRGATSELIWTSFPLSL